MVRQVFFQGASMGLVAAILVTVVLLVCGVVELNRALVPWNCVSHILWGEIAFDQVGFTWKHTVAGLMLNLAAIVMWGVFYEAFLRVTNMRLARVGTNAAAVIIAVTAYVVDYFIVPSRLTPGFEARLSASSLVVVYAALAVGLMTGDRIVRIAQRMTMPGCRTEAKPATRAAR